MTDRPKNSGNEKNLNAIAEQSGLAVVVVDKDSRALLVSNNNSICGELYSSAEFAPRCAEFCGKAYASAVEAGAPTSYECHAGLQCRAVPIKSGKKQLVAIIGRAFLSSRNYRNATARAVAGDWRSFPPSKLFENVIIAGSPSHLDKLEQQVKASEPDISVSQARNEPEPVPKNAEIPKEAIVETAEKPTEAPPVIDQRAPDPFESSLLNYNLDTSPAESEGGPDPFASSMMNFRLESLPAFHQHDASDREAWQAFIPSLLQVSYRLACQRILEFLARHYGIESSIWLQPEGKEFEVAAAIGEFANGPMKIGITTDDKRIRAAVRDDSPILLKERQAGSVKHQRLIQLFPVVIGGRVRNALGVASERMDPELSGRVLKFCRYVASRLEILRLREAVAERERVSRMLREFNDRLRNVDADNFWQQLMSVSAELVGAERASLLVGGAAEGLTAKAAVGARVDLAHATDIGERVARTILEKGKPVLVTDAARISLPPAPSERQYKTASFISYPITLGERGIAVLNFTDKVNGQRFDKHDIETLDLIAPQLGVAVDRMVLRDKAGEYAQLSITDSLTGLLNRRYLEERLTEEIKRSDRSGEPVSFMMLDVDEFKSYNDRFGHPAGDEALEIIARVLKETLRGADIAARYGGEEFCVLLPQTTTDEAERIAERIRHTIENTKFPKRKVTVSIGIASRSSSISVVRDLIEATDKALYQAKRDGRNRIRTYAGPGEGDDENIH